MQLAQKPIYKKFVEEIEKTNNAKYLFASSIPGHCANCVFYIFYQKLSEKFSNPYFGVLPLRNRSMWCDGTPAVQPFYGILAKDNFVYYSSHVHDYTEFPGGAIDGGREYTRLIGEVIHLPRIQISVREDQIILTKV